MEEQRGRKIGRSTILLVRRRGSKQNAWSTSELFPFPSSSPFSASLPSSPPSLRHPLLPLSSLTQEPPSQLGRHKLLPVAGAFFPIPSLARSLVLRAFPRFTPKRPSCDKKLRELGSATLRLAQLPATRVNLSARGARKLQQPARRDLRRNHDVRSQNEAIFRQR